jgi:dihydropyrimidinase
MQKIISDYSRRKFLKTGLLITGGVALQPGNLFSEEKKVLIKNGLIVNKNNQFTRDILISGEKISEIGNNLSAKKNIDEVIDAKGLQVLPGGIDPHVHITGPFADNFTSGSKAALAGGITTIGNLSWPGDNENLVSLLEEHSKLIASAAIADVMLHPTINNPKQEVIDLLPALAQSGYTSFKIFMAMDNFKENIGGYLKVLQKAKETGMLPMIHCEDQPMLTAATKRLLAEGKQGIEYYPHSRPDEAEAEATRWAVDLCEKMNLPVYIVHLSSKKALKICSEAQKRKLPVYVETRPIYLHLTDEKYKMPEAPLFVGMPPLRKKNDMDALWNGIATGSVQVLGSDHAPWTREQKMKASTIQNFLAGMSNLQEMLPVFYSEGVLKGKINLKQFVSLSSSNAAKLFGLYPQKGIIQKGADADIVIWDPKETFTIKNEDGFSQSGFSIFDGWKITGRPKITIRRGEIVYRNNSITALPGSGKLIKRQKAQLL